MAKVITAFQGVVDGTVYPKNFEPGDEVTGDLAREVVAAGWAVDDEEHDDEGDEGDDGDDGEIVIPENWESLHFLKLRSIAKKIDPNGASNKEGVTATITAYLAAQSEANG